MKKVVIVLIGLLALFSILRVYAAEDQNRINIYPGAIEFADKESEITIGFGLVESAGDKSLIWNIFPVKLSLNTGKTKFSLAINGLSFLTSSGINFEKPLVVSGVHKGDVISFGGKVTIKGKVEGAVWVFGTDAVLESGAEVTGDVVALGGKITADKRAGITGNKYAMPELKIPFLGLLSSANSLQTIRFFIELFQIALFLLLLFLVLYFREEHLKTQALSMFLHWKGALIFVLVSLILLPLLVLFLITSLVGIIMLPVLLVFLIIIAYFGFLSFTIRLGKLFLKKESDSLGHFYMCGLLGLFLLKGPSLVGILLTLLDAPILIMIGNFFTATGAIAVFIAFLYGFGVSLINLRARN